MFYNLEHWNIHISLEYPKLNFFKYPLEVYIS